MQEIFQITGIVVKTCVLDKTWQKIASFNPSRAVQPLSLPQCVQRVGKLRHSSSTSPLGELLQ